MERIREQYDICMNQLELMYQTYQASPFAAQDITVLPQIQLLNNQLQILGQVIERRTIGIPGSRVLDM